jgi:hypothetical protein
LATLHFLIEPPVFGNFDLVIKITAGKFPSGAPENRGSSQNEDILSTLESEKKIL